MARKRPRFKINTKGNKGRKIDIRKTAAGHRRNRISNKTRKQLNKAAIQKFGSKRKAKKNNALVSKKTTFSDLSRGQKRSLGVKGRVSTAKELNALRKAIGFRVDKTSTKGGGIQFAVQAKGWKSEQDKKNWRNKTVKEVNSVVKNLSRSNNRALNTLRNSSNTRINALTASNLGLSSQLGALQGQYDKAIDQINSNTVNAGNTTKINNQVKTLQTELGTLEAQRTTDLELYNTNIGNLNTLVNDLSTQTENIVSSYEEKIAQDKIRYESELSDLRSAYARQETRQSRMDALYAEQAQRAENLKRAFVPSANKTAEAPVIGDARQSPRNRRRNAISNLSITTGLGRNANPLAGLQLA